MLLKAYETGREKGLNLKVGNVFTTDMFYNDNAEHEKWARYRILAVEMETAALYTLAAKFGRKALSILTVSDHIMTGEATTAEERQTSFNDMIELALETVIKIANASLKLCEISRSGEDREHFQRRTGLSLIDSLLLRSGAFFIRVKAFKIKRIPTYS